MHAYITRQIEPLIRRRLGEAPAVAIVGPRQCGKTTLAQSLVAARARATYVDLERPADLNKLKDPEAFFEINAGRLICLDEIHRVPDLFRVLRSVMDRNRSNGQFLILGSASPDVLRQSSETLAGRIAYLYLSPLLLSEIWDAGRPMVLRELWLRGGFPRSYLAQSRAQSLDWRLDFIQTYLERDVPNLGFRIPPTSLGRFWRMCAHVHGQILNSSKLGQSLDVSHHTVRSYVDLLDHTFLLRVLPPLEANLKKRLVKSPKVYIRDTGMLHALLDIETHDDLLSHPVYGASWEGFVIENIIASLPRWRPAFFRTAAGEEIDLVLEKGQSRIAVECKASTSPTVTPGLDRALADLGISAGWVIAPVRESYPVSRSVTVISLIEFLAMMQKRDSEKRS